MPKKIDLSQPDVNPAHYMIRADKDILIKSFKVNKKEDELSDSRIIVNYIRDGKKRSYAVGKDGFFLYPESETDSDVLLRPEYANDDAE